MKKNNLLVLVFVILVILGFFFVASRFGGGEKRVESEKPITTCQADKCFYTAHIHMTVEGVVLSYEKGSLQGPHTHAERNIIHWHATLPVDPSTQQVTDYSPLKLKAVLDELGISYQDKKVTVLVNGEEKAESLEYIWQDGDKVEVRIK